MPSNYVTALSKLESLPEQDQEGIFATPAGTFEVKYREHGRQRAKTKKTLKLALEFKEEVAERRDEGKRVLRKQDVPTFREFAIQELARRDIEDSTLKDCVHTLEKHLFPYFGDLPLLPGNFRPRHIAAWQGKLLASGAGPSRVGKAQGLLSRTMRSAVVPFEYLDADPTAYLEAPKYDKRESRWLTAVEVEAMRTWFLERDDLGSATLISGLAYIGPRPQMFLALDWAKFPTPIPRWVRYRGAGGAGMELTHRNSYGKIHRGSKTKRNAQSLVYIPGPVVRDFTAWREAGTGVGLVFPRSDGRPWTKTDYDNWSTRARKKPEQARPRCFKAAAEAVGLGSGVTPYSLRHTAASLYAAAGWTHVEVGQQLVHGPKTSMDIYQHLFDQGETVDPNRRSVEDYILEARGIAPVRTGELLASGS